MAVEAGKAIQFECEECGRFQYESDVLAHGWHEGRAVMEDRIDCMYCGHENHVIQEL